MFVFCFACLGIVQTIKYTENDHFGVFGFVVPHTWVPMTTYTVGFGVFSSFVSLMFLKETIIEKKFFFCFHFQFFL